MKHKSIVYQVKERLRSMAAWGQSKHADKDQNGGKPAIDKIYSYSTMHNYIDAAARFVKWARAFLDTERPGIEDYSNRLQN